MKLNLKNNTVMKVMSLVIALGIWFVVGNIDDPVKSVVFSDIPVQVVNTDIIKDSDKTYEIIEGDTISLSVRGKASIVDKLSADDFIATADFSKLSFVNAVPIDVTASRYANQLDISLGRVDTLKVNIENRAEKMLPVVVETEGQVAAGYAVGTKTSSPNMVEVFGSESMINRLKEVRVKVNVAGRNEDLNIRKTVIYYDQNGDVVNSPTIECDTNWLDITVALWKTKEIPVIIETTGTPMNGYGISTFDYNPKMVLIAAEKEALEKVTELKLAPLNIKGLSEGLEQTINLDSSALPSGVVFESGTVDIVAKASIEKKLTKKIKLDVTDIEIKGKVPEGKTLSFDKKTYQIEVETFGSRVNHLTGAAFEPYIDLQELTNKNGGNVLVHLNNPAGATVATRLEVKIKIQ